MPNTGGTNRRRWASTVRSVLGPSMLTDGAIIISPTFTVTTEYLYRTLDPISAHAQSLEHTKLLRALVGRSKKRETDRVFASPRTTTRRRPDNTRMSLPPGSTCFIARLWTRIIQYGCRIRAVLRCHIASPSQSTLGPSGTLPPYVSPAVAKVLDPITKIVVAAEVYSLSSFLRKGAV
jgi:hypothetical protein